VKNLIAKEQELQMGIEMDISKDMNDCIMMARDLSYPEGMDICMPLIGYTDPQNGFLGVMALVSIFFVSLISDPIRRFPWFSNIDWSVDRNARHEVQIPTEEGLRSPR